MSDYEPTIHDDEGWNCEPPGIYQHYFIDRKSLCGKYERFIGRFWDKEVPAEKLEGQGERYCKKCGKLLREILEERQRGKP